MRSVCLVGLLCCGACGDATATEAATAPRDAADTADTANDTATTTGEASTSDAATSTNDTATSDTATNDTLTNEASTSDAATSTSGLRTDVSPGGNFDLRVWELQEPIGAPGAPTMITSKQLVGPSGFHDAYFFTDTTDGAMTFWTPESGVHTANSNYPRSELREMNPDGSAANWGTAGTHTLTASLAVTKTPDHVCVGQIHIGDVITAGLPVSTKPLVELYVFANGDIKAGVEDSPSGSQTQHLVGHVPIGTRFSYAIVMKSDGSLDVTIDGATTALAWPSSFAGYGEYFKAGSYNQSTGSDATIGSEVKFYALSVVHAP
jgi:hypothetical protein